MELTLAVDCGTTNLKAGVVTPSGNVLSYSSSPIELHSPESHAAEHHPAALFDAFKSTVREVAADYKDDINALGLSGYQFGFIPLDADFTPVMGMITLLDGRSRGVVSSLTENISVEAVYEKTGLPPMFTSLLAKIAWIRDEKPEVYKKTEYYGDIKSFLIQKLTGKFVTEPSIAATTQLLNFATMQWDDELLETVGITQNQMPGIESGDKILCEITDPMAQELGLKSGTPLLPGLYDGGAMMVGMGALTGQEGVCSIGTSTMLRICVDEPVLDNPAKRRLQTYPLFENKWATGGGINNGGVVLQWCKDRLLNAESYEPVLEEAKAVRPGVDGLICLPYLSGERDPRISEKASGMFFGIRPQHGPEHFTRAILEGVTCTVNLIKDAATDNGIPIDEIRICGSGSQSDLWCQIFADVCNIPVNRSAEKDATLLGTSLLAGAAVGTFSDLQAATDHMVHDGDLFHPDSANRETYDALFECFQQILPDSLSIFEKQNSYWQHIRQKN